MMLQSLNCVTIHRISITLNLDSNETLSLSFKSFRFGHALIRQAMACHVIYVNEANKNQIEFLWPGIKFPFVSVLAGFTKPSINQIHTVQTHHVYTTVNNRQCAIKTTLGSSIWTAYEHV